MELICLWPSHSISDPETLASQALKHLKHFDDSDLECKFYGIMTFYYQEIQTNLVEAANMCEKSITLAIQTGNSLRHSDGLCLLAWNNMQLGEYSVAQMYAYEAQKLARVSGYLYTEAAAARTEAICWKELGHYKQSLSLASMAQSLLGLCGMSGCDVNLGIMHLQAEVHKCKAEYTLLNFAEIEVLMAAPKHDVQRNIDLSRSMITNRSWIVACDSVLGICTLGRVIYVQHSCFLRNVSTQTQVLKWNPSVLKGWVMPASGVLVIQCLQFFGDIFLHQEDEDNAIALFTVALEGFTYMDVHQSRAECMLRLGDISNSHGDLLEAVEHWTTAQPLFERSSQAKQLQSVKVVSVIVIPRHGGETKMGGEEYKYHS
ncbi:hypothetical protein B0H14DRAFT_3124550 [Mycena olivaceomarginata]|nr:hypothetical protein B0H14DRAFT_3124550 [Mycena olivaceomarginata]